MSGIDVRMNYGQMDAMAKAYAKARADMGDSLEQIEKIPAMLEQGALIGDAAKMFKDAVKDVLWIKMVNIEQKLMELADDIKGAKEKTETGVSTSKSRFA